METHGPNSYGLEVVEVPHGGSGRERQSEQVVGDASQNGGQSPEVSGEEGEHIDYAELQSRLIRLIERGREQPEVFLHSAEHLRQIIAMFGDLCRERTFSHNGGNVKIDDFATLSEVIDNEGGSHAVEDLEMKIESHKTNDGEFEPSSFSVSARLPTHSGMPPLDYAVSAKDGALIIDLINWHRNDWVNIEVADEAKRSDVMRLLHERLLDAARQFSSESDIRAFGRIAAATSRRLPI